MTTGAVALVRTLVDAGVEVCFSNPGTSEMHFVAALDTTPGLRGVLCLFEGVATGAADGYARMADKPAAALLHLGCGLGNGLANLHNARKGRVPVLAIVGDHATHHVVHDAQLQSDIETVARNVAPDFVRTSRSPAELCGDAIAAIRAAHGRPGRVATLILPADVSWSEGATAEPPPEITPPPHADDATVAGIAAVITSGRRVALLLGGRALREPGLAAAARIAAASGVRLFAETFPTRLERGAGLPPIERIAYLAELAAVQLRGLDDLILVDAKDPVSFFAYPGKRSRLAPDTCRLHTLATSAEDAVASLEKLARALGAAGATAATVPAARPGLPRGRKLTAEKVCKAVGALMPADAILIDEAISSGLMLSKFTAGAPRHDLLTLTGGAIGQGLPNAVGAAIACPRRPVIALVGDGSAMYTIQALWTAAREKLDITAIVFANAAYAVLNMELSRVGAAEAGPQARAQFDLGRPTLDFARVAEGMGVPASRAATPDDFVRALRHALATPGPHLVEAIVPPALSGAKLRLLPTVLGSLESLPAPLARLLKRKLAP